MEDIKKKIEYLSKQIDTWNYEYYALDNPSVSDAYYDEKMKELIALEKEYPQYKLADSPTARVGGYVLEKFEKIKHIRPMLSLDNIFNYEGLIKFADMIRKSIDDNPIDYVVEPKIDGLSISIFYENCKLKYACTRGDGEYGEDVTNNVLTISEIPLYINKKFEGMQIEIRGEVYISIETLKTINSESEKKFANCRNAAAGALRNLDSSVTKARKLQAFFYYVFSDELTFNTHYEKIMWLKENNFKVADSIKLCKDIDEVWKTIENFGTDRSSLNYEIDGVVIKVNQEKYYEDIGYTSKFPKWAIAYKFPATIVSTKILSITPTVGRTGKITYVANLEPINLDGSTISNATLHNKDFILKKDIRINDYVNIYKAGDVIPYVDNVLLEKRTDECIKYVPITYCPSCNEKLYESEGEIDQFCLNKNCKEKILRNIEYFCSRDVMNIEGVSLSIVSKLYDHNIIKNVVDLYKLKDKKSLVFKANINIKEKSFNNIVNAIEKSKNNSLERTIASFAIKGVGITVAKILAKKFKKIDELMKASIDELMKVNIIGDKIAQNIYDFFKDEENIKAIIELKNIGINMEYIPDTSIANYSSYAELAKQDTRQKYHNKTFVITGSFEQPRNAIKTILEECYGAKVVNSITKNVDYLIVGENGGSKLEKAKSLGINIISNEFWKE